MGGRTYRSPGLRRRIPVGRRRPFVYIGRHEVDHDGHRAVRRADIRRALSNAPRRRGAGHLAGARSQRETGRAGQSPARPGPRTWHARSSSRKTSTAPNRCGGCAAFDADLLVVCDYGQILAGRNAGRRPPGWHQPARLAAAEIPRGRADQLGHLPRRARNGRDGDPHDAQGRRRARASPRPPPRSSPTKPPSNWSGDSRRSAPG